MQIQVKFYKVLGLPSEPVANAFYFVEDEDTGVAETYVTNADGEALYVGNTAMFIAFLSSSEATIDGGTL